MKPAHELTSSEVIELHRGYVAGLRGQMFTFLETELWRRGWMLWSETEIAAYCRTRSTGASGPAATAT